jgi:hypothetical protein
MDKLNYCNAVKTYVCLLRGIEQEKCKFYGVTSGSIGPNRDWCLYVRDGMCMFSEAREDFERHKRESGNDE